MTTNDDRFLEPGYIPTPEDVAAVIEREGQWGSVPKACSDCNGKGWERSETGYALACLTCHGTGVM